jgi:hypothetical protein
LRFSFRANTTGRSVQGIVSWWTAAGAFISNSPTVSGTDNSSSYTELTQNATSPATAAFASLQFKALATAAAEKHRIDKVFFGPGTVAQCPWARGGITSLTVDVEVRDSAANPWGLLRGGQDVPYAEPAYQEVEVYDAEFIPRVSREYRARVEGLAVTTPLSSAWSVQAANTWTTTTKWWLTDPLLKSSILVKVKAPFEHTQPIFSGKFYPEGTTKAVVVSDGKVRGREFTMAIWIEDLSDENNVENYMVPEKTLMLKDPIGKAWYFRVLDEVKKEFMRSYSTTSLRKNVYILTYKCVEVEKPAVP